MTEITHALNVFFDGSVVDESDPLMRPLVVPEGKRVGYVLRNFERPPYYLSRPSLKDKENHTHTILRGLPDTVPFSQADRVMLGHDEQWFWFRLLKQAAPNMTNEDLQAAWASLTDDGRAFTNGAGSRTRADYINGTNLNAGPMRFIPMAMGGSVVEIVGGPIHRIFSPDLWEIRTMPYSNMTADPYVIFWATNSCREGYNIKTRLWSNEKIEEPFPQLDWLNVPVPMFNATDVGRIECSRVKVLFPGDQIFSPYFKAV